MAKCEHRNGQLSEIGRTEINYSVKNLIVDPYGYESEPEATGDWGFLCNDCRKYFLLKSRKKRLPNGHRITVKVPTWLDIRVTDLEEQRKD